MHIYSRETNATPETRENYICGLLHPHSIVPVANKDLCVQYTPQQFTLTIFHGENRGQSLSTNYIVSGYGGLRSGSYRDVQ